MQIAKTVSDLMVKRAEFKGTVGFVPTMGALHAGHLTLIKEAKKLCDFVVVSLFVNPTQFLAGEDLDSYPRKMQADELLCRAGGVDLMFVPDISEIYGADEVKICAPKVAGFVLEGAFRPSHFDGVLTVVNKLFNIVKPTKAFFGKKDAQQLILIEKMVKNLFIDIEIVPVNTVRESTGLALSSRNSYLDKDGLISAQKLSNALFEASKLIKQNIIRSDDIKRKILDSLKPLDVDYIEIVNRDLMQIDSVIKGETIILIAAKVNGVRLIDNMWV